MEELSNVRTLKHRLQKKCGTPRFRQRLLQDGNVLTDDFCFNLSSTTDVQIVLRPYTRPSLQQIDELLTAAARGRAFDVDAILQRPQDPNLVGFGGLTALGKALDYGTSKHVEVVRLLLEARADKDQTATDGNTVLCMEGVSAWP